MDKKLEHAYNRTLVRCLLNGQQRTTFCCEAFDSEHCPLDNTEMPCDCDCGRTFEEWKKWYESQTGMPDTRTINTLVGQMTEGLDNASPLYNVDVCLLDGENIFAKENARDVLEHLARYWEERERWLNIAHGPVEEISFSSFNKISITVNDQNGNTVIADALYPHQVGLEIGWVRKK